MTCACGKPALYRVGDKGYCSLHRVSAVNQIQKFGNPRARKTKHSNGPVLKHIDKPSPSELKEKFRKRLKANPTRGESALIDLLKTHPETHRRYEFQPLLHGYIPDFLNRRAKLIIEVDGAVHFTTAARRADSRRTAHLRTYGYDVIRFTNSQVMECPQTVLETIINNQRARLDNDAGTR